MKVYLSNYPKGRSKRTERVIRVRIDPYDIWEMDTTLAHIITPMLKKLKEAKHGVPVVDDEDAPEELRTMETTSDDPDFEKKERMWNWIMNEMIWAFEQKLVHWEDQFYTGNSDIISTCINPELPEEERLYETTEGPNDTFKIDMEAYMAHQHRMSNGFRLFGKYYEACWD